MKNGKRILSDCLSMCLIVITLAIAVTNLTRGTGSLSLNMLKHNKSYFNTFTIDSNLFMALCAIIRLALGHSEKCRRFTTVLFYTGTTCVALTMVTVLLFLGPLQWTLGKSYFSMFADDMLFFHLLNPLMAITAMVLDGVKLKLRHALIAIVPVIVYSVVYVRNVIFVRCWSDFYNFTFGGKMYMAPVMLIVMYGAAFLIALGIGKAHNKCGVRSVECGVRSVE